MNLPLLFTIREKVSGKGFVADITAMGRVLAVKEEAGTWICGVTPGGLSAGGKTGGEAYLNFKKAFISVLYDIAYGSEDFSEFSREVESFFCDECEATLREWKAAVEEVRESNYSVEGLPKLPADRSNQVEVLEITKPTPEMNIIEEQEQALAA